MPTLDAEISGFVRGNDLSIRRDILDVPDGQTIAQAWMTIKEELEDVDADAILQKVISLVNQVGTGHIEDSGVSGTGTVRFDLIRANTLLLRAGRLYHFDVQLKTSANFVYTPLKGTIMAVERVTEAG